MIGKVTRKENPFIADCMDYQVHIFQENKIVNLTIHNKHWESELNIHLSLIYKRDISILFSNEMESEVYCYILT